MDWARILAFATGLVDQELLARHEYLAAENRILKAQLKRRLKLSDAERAILGEIGHRLGRTVLAEVANVARPDTILGWYRKLVARKFDGSKARRSPGRPRIKREVEQLIIRMARENRDWGYDRIAGRSKRTCDLASSVVPRGTSFHRAVELVEGSPIYSCALSCHCDFPGPAELGAVNP
jgi:hypothetical protein